MSPYPNRCAWCNLKNPLYITYHDTQWGVLRLDDAYLFEMLLLECFQAGLSWECVLNKRENFRQAFDGFDPKVIANYSTDKVDSLLQNSGIIRNRRKILAAIQNAQVFLQLQEEFGSFRQYLLCFWDGTIIYDFHSTRSPLSDQLSADLSKRGMRFVGSTILHAFLQAIGIVNAHEAACFLYPIDIENQEETDGIP